MKSFSSRIIKDSEQDGWFPGARGDHHYFKHKTKPGKITVLILRKMDPKTAKKAFSAQD